MANRNGKPIGGAVAQGLDRRSFLQRTSLLVAGAPLVWTLGRTAAAAGSEVIAETAAGKVRGKSMDGINTFLGVPYGSPTFGKRFIRATAPASWTGMRDTLEYGPRSPFVDAPNSPQAKLIEWNSPPGKESDDCLVLNVWTPGVKDGRKRPVMFWLHGGGYATGSGSHPSNNGARLARRGDVVVVTINHRIGFLGFLDLAHLGGSEYADSGNIGMLDAVLALEWVRDNIASFGGDPNCVMIFGESGGGGKVITLLGMPEANGLFHRAAIESGAGVWAATPDSATKTAETFLGELGINKSNLGDIQKLPVERLKAAQASLDGKRIPMFWEPVVDGRSLPADPFDPAAPSISAHIPVLIGTNRTEATFFELDHLDKIYALDDDGTKARLKARLGDDTDEVINLYRRYYPKASAPEIYLYISTEMIVWITSVRVAQLKAAQKAGPVHMYVFDWQTPVLDGKVKSPHGIEIPFVFDNTAVSSGFVGTGPDLLPLAAKVSASWAAFARTGSPRTKDLPWEPYTLESRATMMLGNDSHVVKDPWKEARPIYEKHFDKMGIRPRA